MSGVREDFQLPDEAAATQKHRAQERKLPVPAMRQDLRSKKRASETRHQGPRRQKTLRNLRQTFRARNVPEPSHEKPRSAAILLQLRGLRETLPLKVSAGLPR